VTVGDVIDTTVGTASVLHRLQLGVVVRDGINSRGAADGIRVGWEAHPRLLPRRPAPWWPCLDLERLGGGRFRLRSTAARPGTIVVRLVDPARRYVPRRLETTLWPHDVLADPTAQHVPVASRTMNVWLSPGAAYPIPRGATAIRGRVADGSTPVPWARLVAVGPGNAVLGRAQADDRSEFLLILLEVNQNPVQSTVPIDLHVRGPADTTPLDHPDPLAALTPEVVPRPGVPPAPADLDSPLLRGSSPLPGSVPSTVPPVHLIVPVGGELSLADDISFQP
jgi:hypothetical protein